MLKLGRVTKLKMLFLVLVFVFKFDLFNFVAAILEKGLLSSWVQMHNIQFYSQWNSAVLLKTEWLISVDIPAI